MYLDGFGFAGFRGFTDFTAVGPLSKINLVIGQNNVGKSVVLRFLRHHYPAAAVMARGGQADLALSDLDRPRVGEEKPLEVGTAYRRTSIDYADLAARIVPNQAEQQRPFVATALEQMLAHESFSVDGGDDLAWFRFGMARGRRDRDTMQMLPSFLESAREALPDRSWSRVWQSHKPDHQGGSIQGWVNEVLSAAYAALADARALPKITLVPAIREVKTLDGADGDFSGTNLIDQLAELEQPDHNEQRLKLRFAEINAFVSSVLGDPEAHLTIPASRGSINVHLQGGVVLPLEAIGTGVHELIILAAASTVLNEQILCLEEPEIHVHPVMQRKLINYLNDHTTNQYLIATHSAHVLDTPGATVIHVTRNDSRSAVRVAASNADRFDICSDLGYRASDLLQSNCVLWVEGPSDRVYLRHWLGSLDDELVEGIHYSIMFYGGRLLSHLSAEDPAVTDFIDLRRLNRRLAIVIDSDRASRSARINATKRRVVNEFNESDDIAWVTTGREIENYVPQDLLAECVTEAHPGATLTTKVADRYSDVTTIRRAASRAKTTFDKVRVAHLVAERPADLSLFGLRKNVEGICRLVRNANGL